MRKETERNSASPPLLVTPLGWDVPAAWTVLPVATGSTKASYRTEPVGNDKESADVTVLFFGTGSRSESEPVFKEWFNDFDGNLAKEAKRERFQTHGLEIEIVEGAGTFKQGLGPKIGGNRRSPVQMVKKSFRMVGAAVKTQDRGTWFFRMIGPDETVQSARGAFRSLLESSR